MVSINRVITRGGDAGETSLGDGERVPKEAPRIETIGAVDEANAVIGLLRLHADPETDAMLARIQNDLFDVGADICVPEEGGEGGAPRERLRLTAAPTARLEAETAEMNAGLPALTSFVLPGGTPAAAHAHLARTVVRRAERRVVALSRNEPVNSELIRYLNRLSDHLFVLSRRLNAGSRGAGASGDVLWLPGANR